MVIANFLKLCSIRKKILIFFFILKREGRILFFRENDNLSCVLRKDIGLQAFDHAVVYGMMQ